MQRYEETDHIAADWVQIERQRAHFLKWEPDTALFVDAINPFEENHAKVFAFVLQDGAHIRPLDTIELTKGSYHQETS